MQHASPRLDIPAATAAIAKVAGGPAMLHAPEIGGNEWIYIKECLDTEWVSTVGAYVDRFERMLAEYTGTTYAIATVNGTAALHICLVLAGVRPGDEVIVPSLTFVATANAVAYCGATCHFADVEETSLGMDAARLDAHLADIVEQRDGRAVNRLTNRPIGAVVCMHTFGHPVDLDALAATCARYGLPFVEDAAESLGSTYKGRHTGHHGLAAALSFNGNKIVTTGGGGAILTNVAAIAKRAKHLTTTAKVPHPFRFDHDEVGYNYRLPNINAAMGCAQMERLAAFVEEKRALAGRYAEALAGVPGLRSFIEPSYARSNYWLNVALLNRGNEDQLEPLLAALNDAKLQSRPAWTPMHHLPMYAECPRMDLAVTESIAARLINIPSSPRLGRAPQA